MSKKHDSAKEKIDRTKQYELKEAVDLVKQLVHTKFDETVDLAVRLGIDPKKSDQMVRGSVVLPHGLGKKIRVLVFAKGEKAMEAQSAGADFVGAEDLVEKFRAAGWTLTKWSRRLTLWGWLENSVRCWDQEVSCRTPNQVRSRLTLEKQSRT